MSTPAPTMEYLGTPRRRRPTGLLALAIVLAVVLAGILLGVSEWVRRGADAEFASSLEQAHEASRAGEARVLSTLAYASPMIWSESVPADVRAGLRELVQESSGEVADRLGSVDAHVAGVTVLPWQRQEQQTRNLLRLLIDEHRQRFETIAADATTIGAVLGRDAPSSAAVEKSLRASGANGT